jgi:hypothetical protein
MSGLVFLYGLSAGVYPERSRRVVKITEGDLLGIKPCHTLQTFLIIRIKF